MSSITPAVAPAKIPMKMPAVIASKVAVLFNGSARVPPAPLSQSPSPSSTLRAPLASSLSCESVKVVVAKTENETVNSNKENEKRNETNNNNNNNNNLSSSNIEEKKYNIKNCGVKRENDEEEKNVDKSVLLDVNYRSNIKDVTSKSNEMETNRSNTSTNITQLKTRERSSSLSVTSSSSSFSSSSFSSSNVSSKTAENSSFSSQSSYSSASLISSSAASASSSTSTSSTSSSTSQNVVKGKKAIKTQDQNGTETLSRHAKRNGKNKENHRAGRRISDDDDDDEAALLLLSGTSRNREQSTHKQRKTRVSRREGNRSQKSNNTSGNVSLSPSQVERTVQRRSKRKNTHKRRQGRRRNGRSNDEENKNANSSSDDDENVESFDNEVDEFGNRVVDKENAQNAMWFAMTDVSSPEDLIALATREGLICNKEELDKKNAVSEEGSKNDTETEVMVVTANPPRPPVIRSFPTDIDAAIRKYKERLNREENAVKMKDDTKAVSLGTSKINYIDPRIVCSWASAQNVPINKLFSATLINKFPWALNSHDFDF